MKLLPVLLLGVCSTLAFGQQRTLMHCFTFTEVPEATAADWDAFKKATEELPSRIAGLKRVWHGKLARPLGLLQTAAALDAENQKKLREGEAVPVQIKMIRRQYGVCMEFEGPDALKAYAKDPAHEAWVKVYEKVRVAGTTTFDILP